VLACERLLVVVLCLWIEDYQHGKVYQGDGRLYRITRYVHAVDYDFHEVWGCEMERPHVLRRPTRPQRQCDVGRASWECSR